MSKLLISQYLNDLARLKQVGGTHRESVVSEAFKDLLKEYARSHDLMPESLPVPDKSIGQLGKQKNKLEKKR